MRGSVLSFLPIKILLMIVTFINNHFEIFVCITFAMTGMFITLLICVLLSDVFRKGIFNVLVYKILYIVCIVGLPLALGFSTYVYYINYHALDIIRPIRIPEDVRFGTQWVKSHLRIYFIKNNQLNFVQLNGEGFENFFEAKEIIKEYHFSPNGKYMMVMTQHSLYWVDVETKQYVLVDEMKQDIAKDGLNGILNKIRWSPNSELVCYKKSKWSKFSSQESLHVYNVALGESQKLDVYPRKILSLYWGELSENLYYFKKEALDTETRGFNFMINVFEINLKSQKSKKLWNISSQNGELPKGSLAFRNIHVFTEGESLSFGNIDRRENLLSETGSSLHFDEQDYLVYVDKWFHKRLMKIARAPVKSDTPRHQYKGGHLVIKNIRWVPGGRYVLMEHKTMGLLVMDPQLGIVGSLIESNGKVFGWHVKIADNL